MLVSDFQLNALIRNLELTVENGGLMADAKRKPWLTASQQIDHLKSRGVHFSLMSEDDARAYLEKNNNYFRLRAYRLGFPKVEEGVRKGEYANLDFKMLVDLSIVDMLLRYEMLPLTLDVEHFAKVKLLKRIETEGEDGYAVVSDFISSYDDTKLDGTSHNSLKDEIRRCKNSPYTGGLIARYADLGFPTWAFIEVISFGSFLYFYRFCANRFDDREMLKEFYILQAVKSLRNACAHNSCILNKLRADRPQFKPSYVVTRELSTIAGIGLDQRKSKMSNDRIQQIVTTLYAHRELASQGVSEHRAKSLAVFVQRMNRHVDYYRGNLQVSTGFDFLTKVISAWFPANVD